MEACRRSLSSWERRLAEMLDEALHPSALLVVHLRGIVRIPSEELGNHLVGRARRPLLDGRVFVAHAPIFVAHAPTGAVA